MNRANNPRLRAIAPGRVSLWMGEQNELAAMGPSSPGHWHLLSAAFDGHAIRLFYDGSLAAAGTLTMGPATPVLQIGPPAIGPLQVQHFGGRIAAFTVQRQALTDADEHQLFVQAPDFNELSFEEGLRPWPIQTHAWGGYQAPQDPATMPRGRAPYSAPVARKRPPIGPSLVPGKPGEWTFNEGWTLKEAPAVRAGAEVGAAASFHDQDWMRATVSGTVLTTMIDDGIYPDPAYGLNNLAIPKRLNKQDYWYRNAFQLPAAMRSALGPAGGRHVLLTFAGINYTADIWLNGSLLGTVKGAFRRGQVDVTTLLRPGETNVLAVRISPPPHPGIPQEQSVLGGSGENGGSMELDGPTFLATEGWDWIPAVRDRNSGIWQPVTLSVTGALRLGDAQVLPAFLHHAMTEAEVTVHVPVVNLASGPQQGTVAIHFDGVTAQKQVTLAPGANSVTFTPAEFPQLRVQHPRLWWPNGYGKPELYTLHVTAAVGAAPSDSKDVRFGMREISYELSLLDPAGDLKRVQFTPAAAPDAAKPIVDVSHEGMRPIPSADGAALNIPENRRDEYQFHSTVSSLAPGAESSPSIESSSDQKTAPYLVIVVNGVRIAARGGNWGMDDFRKRVSRERLEPFFRLHRDANLNIIRNWVGQNTEETFYDLADEYGMLIWNDFWESTQNYTLEAEDPDLFLANTQDTTVHFRNHPSIALWCGRNEGVPQPILNAGLERLVRTLDGARFSSPSSNQINLQQSGPYSYQDPAQYASALNRGFSVETGTPSMSTLESFMSSTPAADPWPIDDVWAYHDWHPPGNGRVEPFMNELTAEFGAPTSLADFERKAQMLNYVDHRAIFEGMHANLWAPNSGRLLWMTQPAWPSTMWPILSSAYDTQASFYGSKKACEPLHVQLNAATNDVDIINTTTEPHADLTVSAKVYSLTNKILYETRQKRDIAADDKVNVARLDLAPFLAQGVVLVELELSDAQRQAVSKNLYWLANQSSQYRELTRLATAAVNATASAKRNGEEYAASVQLTNTGSVVALANKLTLTGIDGARLLPAYYSDNSAKAAGKQARIALRGWNTEPASVTLKLAPAR